MRLVIEMFPWEEENLMPRIKLRKRENKCTISPKMITEMRSADVIVFELILICNDCNLRRFYFCINFKP